jgi:rhamnogalacturonan endolyase
MKGPVRPHPFLLEIYNAKIFFLYFLVVSFSKVRVNDAKAQRPLFTSGLIGRDNAIARHGIHGLYRLYNVSIPGARLVEGENTIFLTQPRCTSPFQGLMYDYIRLEGPPFSGSSNEASSSFK